jgi:DNA-3-methyladenine glycosylase II
VTRRCRPQFRGDKGAQRLDGADAMPTPRVLSERGERWGPYRTHAAMYLWRIADSVTAAAPVKRSQAS